MTQPKEVAINFLCWFPSILQTKESFYSLHENDHIYLIIQYSNNLKYKLDKCILHTKKKKKVNKISKLVQMFNKNDELKK